MEKFSVAVEVVQTHVLFVVRIGFAAVGLAAVAAAVGARALLAGRHPHRVAPGHMVMVAVVVMVVGVRLGPVLLFFLGSRHLCRMTLPPFGPAVLKPYLQPDAKNQL